MTTEGAALAQSRDNVQRRKQVRTTPVTATNFPCPTNETFPVETRRRVPPPTSAQPHGGHTAATPVPALAAEEGRAETKLNHADESGGTMLPEGDRRPTPGLQAEKDETWEELQEAKPRRLEAGERSEEGEAEEGLGI